MSLTGVLGDGLAGGGHARAVGAVLPLFYQLSAHRLDQEQQDVLPPVSTDNTELTTAQIVDTDNRTTQVNYSKYCPHRQHRVNISTDC